MPAKPLFTLVLLLLIPIFAKSQDTVLVTPESFGPDQDYFWLNDNVYVLRGDIVLDRGTLWVLAGTQIIIEQDGPIPPEETGLTIGPGGNLLAIGGNDNPIRFGIENNESFGDYEFIQEIRDQTPNWRGLHIVQDDRQDSTINVLFYVSIVNAGASNGDQEGAGLFLENVHESNIMESIEIVDSKGDGVRIHGGNIDLAHIAVTFVDDDAFEWNYGWSGHGMHWTAIGYDFENKDALNGSHLLEGLGELGPNEQISAPVISNATLVAGPCGSGPIDTDKQTMSPAIFFGRGTRGRLLNSIIGHYAGLGIEVEDTPGTRDSRSEMVSRNLRLEHNVWTPVDSCVGGYQSAGTLDTSEEGIFVVTPGGADPEAVFLLGQFIAYRNSSTNDGLRANAWIDCFEFDPRLCDMPTDINRYPLTELDSTWFNNRFTNIDYPGAFPEADSLWYNEQWSFWAEQFAFGNDARPQLTYALRGSESDEFLYSGDTLRIPCNEYATLQRNLNFYLREKICRFFDIGIVAAKRRGNRRRRPRRKKRNEEYAFTQEWTYFNTSTTCPILDTVRITIEVYDTIAPVIHILPDRQGGIRAYLEDCDEAWIYDQKISSEEIIATGQTISTYTYYAEDYSGNRSTNSISITTSDEVLAFFLDFDGDGYGDPQQSVIADSAPEGFVENADDCNDRDPEIPEFLPFGVTCNEYTNPGNCSSAPALPVRTQIGEPLNPINLSVQYKPIPYDSVAGCAGNPNFADSWFSFTATSTKGIRIIQLGNAFLPNGTYHMELYSGACTNLLFERCLDTLTLENGIDISGLLPGKKYYVRVQEVFNINYDLRLDLVDLTALPVNESCRETRSLFWRPQDCISDTVRYFGMGGAPIWHRFHVLPGDSMTIDVVALDSNEFGQLPSFEIDLFAFRNCNNLHPIESFLFREISSGHYSLTIKDLPAGLPVAMAIAGSHETRFLMTNCHYGTLVSNSITMDDGTVIQSYPNPTADYLVLDIDSHHQQKLEISLVDLNGRTIKTLLKDQVGSGRSQKQVSLTGVPSGIYLIQWFTANQKHTEKLVITRN